MSPLGGIAGRCGCADTPRAFSKRGDRLCRYAVIVSDDTGEIVTVLRHRPGPRGRRYRKGVA